MADKRRPLTAPTGEELFSGPRGIFAAKQPASTLPLSERPSDATRFLVRQRARGPATTAATQRRDHSTMRTNRFRPGGAATRCTSRRTEVEIALSELCHAIEDGRGPRPMTDAQVARLQAFWSTKFPLISDATAEEQRRLRRELDLALYESRGLETGGRGSHTAEVVALRQMNVVERQRAERLQDGAEQLARDYERLAVELEGERLLAERAGVRKRIGEERSAHQASFLALNKVHKNSTDTACELAGEQLALALDRAKELAAATAKLTSDRYTAFDSNAGMLNYMVANGDSAMASLATGQAGLAELSNAIGVPASSDSGRAVLDHIRHHLLKKVKRPRQGSINASRRHP